MTINTQDYIDINRELWEKKVDDHVESKFYDVPAFLRGESSLRIIELDLLPEVKNKSLLHLQCHFGLDTLSLGRLGAEVTGLDFSPKAIEHAKSLANQTKSNANFICGDVYDTRDLIKEQFDVVFTSYGTIGWLPDIVKWANVVNDSLKPGGEFFFAEFHPFVWMFDDDVKEITYAYRNGGAITGVETESYADTKEDYQSPWVCWNYGISDVVQSLIDTGLKITHMSEYNFSPYQIFPDMEKSADQVYRIKRFGNKIPLVYVIKAQRPL